MNVYHSKIEQKRAMRTWIPHLSKQVEFIIPTNLTFWNRNMRNTDYCQNMRHWLKVKEWSWPLLQQMFLYSFFLLYLLTYAPKSSTSSMNSPHINPQRSIRGQYLIILEQKSSKVSMKSYVLAFSHAWPCRKKVKVNPMSLFEQSRLPNVTYQVSRPSFHWFTAYWHSHVT